MDPSSPLVIASRNVASYIIQEKYNDTDYVLPDIPSNLVFEIVRQSRMCLKSSELLIQVDKVLMKMLNPSVMNLTCHVLDYTVNETDIPLIQNQNNLVELKIGDLIDCYEPEDSVVEQREKEMEKKHFGKKDTKKEFNLAAFLEKNLNSRTREKLETFDISRYRLHDDDNFNFKKDWTRSLARALPSLTNLKIAGQDLSNGEFQNLCSSLPRLLSLDIKETGLTSLEGISKLVYLQHLTMGRLKLENAESMEEVYGLNNLKTLNLSGEKRDSSEFNVTNLFIESEKSILKLEELDCSGTRITDIDLNGVLRRHKKLKIVIALSTGIERSEISGIKLLTKNTISSCLLSLKHLREFKPDYELQQIIFKLLNKIRQTHVRQLKAEDLRNAIRMMYQMIPEYENNSDVIERIRICCCMLSCPINFHFYENGDKRILMESFLRIMDVRRSYKEPEDPQHEWEMIAEILRATQDPQVDRIASMALKYFLIADGKKWGMDCLDAIDHVLKRTDIESEYYKEIDKEKLFDRLMDMYKKMPPFKMRNVALRVWERFQKH